MAQVAAIADHQRGVARELQRDLRRIAAPDRLTFPRTGLPRDPYALRPRHLDTARSKGDVLIVTVTADAFVNKGPGRLAGSATGTFSRCWRALARADGRSNVARLPWLPLKKSWSSTAAMV